MLVDGTRQIGKTFSIEKFINQNFENVIEINFAIRSDLIDLLYSNKSSDEILIKLSSVFIEELISNKTVIFF